MVEASTQTQTGGPRVTCFNEHITKRHRPQVKSSLSAPPPCGTRKFPETLSKAAGAVGSWKMMKSTPATGSRAQMCLASTSQTASASTSAHCRSARHYSPCWHLNEWGTLCHPLREPPSALATSSLGAHKRCCRRDREARQVSLQRLGCKNPTRPAYWSHLGTFIVSGPVPATQAPPT